MQHLEPVDEVVNLSHEALHEDDFREANAQVPELGGEGLEFAEIVQLHGGREIEQHVREVRAFRGQLVEDDVSYHLDGELDVAQRSAKAMLDHVKQRLEGSDVKS